MEGGPPVFRADSTCPHVLWIPLSSVVISITGLSPSPVELPSPFFYDSFATLRSEPRRYYYLRFGLFRFRFGCTPEELNLASDIHSPDHSTKGTISRIDALYVLVGTRFQVLFHSPPGVLFTFPSQYYTLSVIGEYLGLDGGPPVFPPGFTCPAVLWIQLANFSFRVRDYHALWLNFPFHSTNRS